MSSLATSVSTNSLNIVSNYDLTEPIRPESVSNTRSSTPVQIAEQQQPSANKRVIKSFFKFIKSSRKNKKKLSSSINNLSQTSSAKEKNKKFSKLRPSKSIAFLNSVNNDSNLSSDECESRHYGKKNSINTKKSDSKHKNRSKKDRSLSLVLRSTVGSPTLSSSSFSSNSLLKKSCRTDQLSISSKELTWYRLEELDDYYKILGKLDTTNSADLCPTIPNRTLTIHFIKTMIK